MSALDDLAALAALPGPVDIVNFEVWTEDDAGFHRLSEHSDWIAANCAIDAAAAEVATVDLPRTWTIYRCTRRYDQSRTLEAGSSPGEPGRTV